MHMGRRGSPGNQSSLAVYKCKMEHYREDAKCMTEKKNNNLFGIVICSQVLHREKKKPKQTTPTTTTTLLHPQNCF